MALNTPITRLLHIKTPIISAPMAGPSGGALAGQVSSAGGLGFIQAGYEDAGSLRKELALASSILREQPGNSTSTNKTLPIGVGFIGWLLDRPDGQTAELLTIALESRIAAVWFAFGNDLGKWVRLVRAADTQRSESQRTIVFVLVNSLQEARKAVDEWDADVIVAQGIEAGGHGQATAPPLMELVPEIIHGLSTSKSGKPLPPVIATGGLSTGAQIAALLTLGASGVALGTRFLLTPEARYKDTQKAALLAADGLSTVRTLAFDIARGTLGWPAGIDGRALKNKTVERFESGENVEDLKHFFQRATLEEDSNGMVVWAGTGVGLVKEIKPAAHVVEELHNELIDSLKRAATLIVKAPEA